MKNVIMSLLTVLPFLTFSQTNNDRTNKDSSHYYEKETQRLVKEFRDSLHNTALFVRYKEYQKRNNNYYAPVIFFNLLHSDYASFNNSISANGFPALDPLSFGFGIGFSTKTRHAIVDFNAVSVSSQNRSRKGGETIGSSLGNIFQFDLGYDVLHSAKLSIYPYAGLSLRIATLSYTKAGAINSTFTNIMDIINGDKNITTSSVRLGYQTGVGVDLPISKNREWDKAVILFAKGGLNQPFGKDTYKIEGQKYDPDIRKGDWMISIGFKIANRFDK